MARNPQNDSHLVGQKSAQRGEDRPAGPVPMHHRLKLGQSVVDDPQGDGRPSTEVKIANSGRKTW